jgi:uncharacterized damage-inducible protein DinB
MGQIDRHGRPLPDIGADETEMLLGFLDYQRATLEVKTRDLDATAWAARIAPSSMTLGGLMHHLAWVEYYWFVQVLSGRDHTDHTDHTEHREYWADATSDRDWAWRRALEMSPEAVRRVWERSCEQSRDEVAAALARGDVNQESIGSWRGDRHPSLRWILLHMIEEYARHNGHADLLREAIDGMCGE